MSRSKPVVNISNPAKVVLEWAGAADAGYFKYYDKEAKEKKAVQLPFKFAYLDEMTAILGFSPKYQSNLFSNEVRFMSETLNIMAFADGKVKHLKEGVYKDIKEDVQAMGGKYHKIIYGAVIESQDEGLRKGDIIRIAIKGSGVSSWGDFKSKHTGTIVVGKDSGKNGAVTYTFPTFESEEISPEDDKMAMEADIKLQEFFEERSKADFSKSDEPEGEAKKEEEPEEDCPY